jgi:hypothetical protein
MEKSEIPKDLLEGLFSNWAIIVELSERLLEKLERNLARWPLVMVGIGMVFLNLVI